MSKNLGRNHPCPCGSGKKYKKCCLAKDTATRKPTCSNSYQPQLPSWDDDDLDELSNSVIELIHNGKLDQAQLACDQLDRRFPDLIDCLERRAMLLEARGETKLAAEYYRRAAQHAQTHDGFDPEVANSLLDSANRLDPLSDKGGT
jgi:tetratricopeptide (TPR) repeat protein